jgi:hypothetical protein
MIDLEDDAHENSLPEGEVKMCGILFAIIIVLIAIIVIMLKC